MVWGSTFPCPHGQAKRQGCGATAAGPFNPMARFDHLPPARLAPPSTLGNKNNFRGRRARDVEEAEESCIFCMAPLWDNTMLFRTACQHTVHARCMKGVFEFGLTTDQ